MLINCATLVYLIWSLNLEDKIQHLVWLFLFRQVSFETANTYELTAKLTVRHHKRGPRGQLFASR